MIFFLTGAIAVLAIGEKAKDQAPNYVDFTSDLTARFVGQNPPGRLPRRRTGAIMARVIGNVHSRSEELAIGTGHYFNFNWEELKAVVSSLETGQEISIKHCRDGAEIYTGGIIAWHESSGPNQLTGDAHGRRNPGESAAPNQWMEGDVIVGQTASCHPGCFVEWDTNFSGNDVSDHDGIATMQDCRSLCASINAPYFTYGHPDPAFEDHCWCKSSDAGRGQGTQTGLVSGFTQCPENIDVSTGGWNCGDYDQNLITPVGGILQWSQSWHQEKWQFGNGVDNVWLKWGNTPTCDVLCEQSKGCKYYKLGSPYNGKNQCLIYPLGACTTASPTSDPTAQPSANPTHVPSSDPTASPTSDPTAQPSANPTSDPTAQPSASPTNVPSSDPTASPTSDPTAQPSASPTSDPTAQPSASPTSDPTAQPSASPTNVPSSDPTASPTPDPTAQPSASPTSDPTAKPTAVPTAEPTAAPTAAPNSGIGGSNDGVPQEKDVAQLAAIAGASAFLVLVVLGGVYFICRRSRIKAQVKQCEGLKAPLSPKTQVDTLTPAQAL